MIIDASVLRELLRGKCCTDPSSLTDDERKELEMYASLNNLVTSNLARLCLEAARGGEHGEGYRRALRVACTAVDLVQDVAAVVGDRDAVEPLVYYYCMGIEHRDLPHELYKLLSALAPRQRILSWLNERQEMCLRALAALGDNKLDEIACSVIEGYKNIRDVSIAAKYVCHVYKLLYKLLDIIQTVNMPLNEVKQMLKEMKEVLDRIAESASRLASLDERIIDKCFKDTLRELNIPMQRFKKLVELVKKAAEELDAATRELADTVQNQPGQVVYVRAELTERLKKINEMCDLLGLL